jgi:hypothetical protein
MYQVSSGLFGCPLAMTDGAAALLKTLEIKEQKIKEKINEAFGHLTSRNPISFWTSGQWMTEKKGGSGFFYIRFFLNFHINLNKTYFLINFHKQILLLYLLYFLYLIF